MPVPRAERLAQIQALQAEGLTPKHIAFRLGIADATVRNILRDPDGAKDRARKASYGGVCVDCGGPTKYSGRNGDQASLRCIYCSQGKRRPAPPDRRRRIPVRLTEIPLDRRMEAAHEACKRENGDWERQAILMAAIAPSEDVYWVAA